MMTFRAFPDVNFIEKQAIKDSEYHVMLNPESFKRTFGADISKDESIGSRGSEGKNLGFLSETYSFSIIIDGTGVVDSQRTKVKDEFEQFMKAVYSHPDNCDGTKPNFVEMIYCGEIFHCKLTSLSVDYELMNRDGTPLRMKLNCSFSSVEPKKETEEGNKETDIPLPAMKAETTDVQKASKETAEKKQCFCIQNTFQEALDKAIEKGQDSLFGSSES